MKLKKFIAPSTREALAKLRAELGDDAIILSTKQTHAGCEVLAASSEDLDGITSTMVKVDSAAKPAAKQAAPASWTRAEKEQMKVAADRTKRVQDSINNQLKQQLQSSATAQPAKHEGLLAAYGADAVSPSKSKPVAKATPKPAASQLLQQLESSNREPLIRVESSDDFEVDMLSEAAHSRASAASSLMDDASAGAFTQAGAQEQAAMLAEIKQMRQLMKDQLSLMTWRSAMEQNPLRSQVWSMLNNSGFSPLFARRVAEKMPDDLTESKAQEWLSQVLRRNLNVITPQEDIVEKGGAYALVGPTGVGKTTTTAKLAARCVVKYGADSLGLVTTDSYRIGAQDQLRIYGKILGVQVYTAQNEADLAQLRNSLSRKRLLLIDTVGMGQRDKRVTEHTQMLVDGHVKRLLLLNATSQPETLDDVVRHYRGRGLEGAILTKLDEAIKLGGMMDVIMRNKLKVHYMATGQRVPEDIFLADPNVLIHRALKSRQSSAFDASDEELKWKMTQLAANAS